jgi:serine/threonine protein kinase
MLALACICAIIIPNWNKHIIFLSNGESIEAGKTWVILDEVFYEKGEGTLFTVKTDAVDEIVNGGFSSFDDWKIIVSRAIETGQGVFGILMRPMTGLICLAMFCLIGILFSIRFILLKKTRAKEKDDGETDELFRLSISHQLPDVEKIVLFFLNIYLMQLQAKRTDRCHYRLTDAKGPLNTCVYDLRANIDGKWQSRRISLGRIGEDSGARSKCFYVIFDDHLVIKIPPEPISGLNQYIESIKADKRIADILAPRECLVPGLSIVLKKVPPFVKLMDKLTGDDEAKCMEALNIRPEFQDFLKSGESFVFYMDLSKYFFLGHILNECHDADDAIARELKKHQEMIWMPAAFADRYGDDASDLCFDLQNIFKIFNNQLNNDAIPMFQKKEWFTGIFQDGKAPASLEKISPEAQAVLNRIKSQHANTVSAYGHLLQKYARERFFKQNLLRIQSICARLVELLAWLFFKDIAIRDLKPDNLLVAGDPSKYPHFLASTDDFEIGLIDVEIAAYIGPGKNGIEQPKLGWTPFYATPSHMFVNEVLIELFDDISYIYKLQDWYAIVAIMYQAVTFEKLFVNTAGTMASMARELPRYFGDQLKMTAFAKNSSARFWKDATSEFESRVKENAVVLKAVNIEIFDNVSEMFQIAAEKSTKESLRRQLAEMDSHISAYDLMHCMFYHVREIMNKSQ